jgi:hypothetical protein
LARKPSETTNNALGLPVNGFMALSPVLNTDGITPSFQLWSRNMKIQFFVLSAAQLSTAE